MNDSRLTITRRRALKYAGLTGLSGVAGLSGLSLTSQPALAVSEPVTLPSGLTEGSVDVSSYEIQYAELDTASDITITYILRTASETLTETHTVSITESTGAVMTGAHSINVPSGEVSLEVQLQHPSVGTVSTQESTPTTIESVIPDSVMYRWEPVEFSEGASTWDGVIASKTMSLVGSLSSVTLSDGLGGVDADGTDDGGYASIISDVSQGGRTWEFELQTSAIEDQYIMGWRDGNTTEAMFLMLNIPNDGNLSFFEYDSGNAVTEVNHTATTLNDGKKHNVTISITNPSTGDVDIIVDGVEDSTVARNNSTGQTNSGRFGFFGRYDPDVNDFSFYGDVSFGIIQFHDTDVTKQYL